MLAHRGDRLNGRSRVSAFGHLQGGERRGGNLGPSRGGHTVACQSRGKVGGKAGKEGGKSLVTYRVEGTWWRRPSSRVGEGVLAWLWAQLAVTQCKERPVTTRMRCEHRCSQPSGCPVWAAHLGVRVSPGLRRVPGRDDTHGGEWRRSWSSHWSDF